MKNTTLEQKLIDEISAFLLTRKCLMLSTVDKSLQPSSSYAPFICYQQNLYIFISQLANHTQSLMEHPQASVMFIEDEDHCADIFARSRLTYSVTASVISREDPLWTEIIDSMSQQLGERIEVLRQLGDFVLFQLMPTAGRYVKGFGKAYELEGEGLASPRIQHLGKK